jgi:hypothetical protein
MRSNGLVGLTSKYNSIIQFLLQKVEDTLSHQQTQWRSTMGSHGLSGGWRRRARQEEHT